VKDDLLRGDFGANLSLLQNYPVQDFDQVIRKAFVLKELPLPELVDEEIDDQE